MQPYESVQHILREQITILTKTQTDIDEILRVLLEIQAMLVASPPTPPKPDKPPKK